MRVPAALICFVALMACGRGSEDTSKSEGVSAKAAAALTPSSVRVESGPHWFAASRELEMSGDNLPDTLLVVAEGRHVDSLVVHLSAIVGGDTILLTAWDAAYMLIDPPDSARALGPSREAYVRSQLASTLDEARVAPFTGAPVLTTWPQLSADPTCGEEEPDCLLAAIASAAGTAIHEDADDAWKLAVVADLARPGRLALTFSYGYESTESHVWSPFAKKFFLAFSCC